jgi:competence protein ComEA
MRRDDDTAGSRRVRQLLDRSFSGATGSGPGSDTAAGTDDVWPSQWPPGLPSDQVGESPELDPGGRSATPGRLGPRWQVPGRAAVAVGASALALVVVLIALLLRGPSSGSPVPPRDPVPFATASSGLLGAATPAAPDQATGVLSGSVQPSGTDAQAVAGQYRVYIVGQVRRPGVVSLAPGARVEDAVGAAGGATEKADLTVMNLARKVVDGERIVVPRPGEKVPTDEPVPAAPDAGTAGAPGAAPGAPVDLNTATVAELDALPGVGPVIAGRIVAWRQQNGRFNRVDDLAEVQGIGAATLEKLRPMVRV